MEEAILAGGCFWCLEAVYEGLDGVEGVLSGYIGGQLADPDYEAVCAGTTGHAEAVRIVFDPRRIDFRRLLEVFFVIHDPTTPNRQGADVGTQYRSAIFHTSEEQRRIAVGLIAELAAAQVFAAPIVTEVQPAGHFYPAEGYHQGYFRNHPGQGYCAYVVAPKLLKARAAFAGLFKPAGR